MWVLILLFLTNTAFAQTVSKHSDTEISVTKEEIINISDLSMQVIQINKDIEALENRAETLRNDRNRIQNTLDRAAEVGVSVNSADIIR